MNRSRIKPNTIVSQAGADYGTAAPIGQVGTPPNAGLEDTQLTPVMPQT